MRAGLRQPGMRVAPLRADLGLPPERPSDDGAGFAGALGGLALQADGKIVAAGTGHDFLGFALARYETDGSLDTTFGGDGRVVTILCAAMQSPEAWRFTPMAKSSRLATRATVTASRSRGIWADKAHRNPPPPFRKRSGAASRRRRHRRQALVATCAEFSCRQPLASEKWVGAHVPERSESPQSLI
jgi:hypothetical protein